MPVCIAGMARSGTSLCARMLNLCGVYLGEESDLLPPAPDNPDGFWENIRFVAVNEELLSMHGGAWDCPPLLPLDSGSEQFAHLRAKAEATLEAFAGHEPWGWKDPRNSLTLPFWRHYFPDMKVVICLRNPLEVAQSLYKRSWYSTELSLMLWYVYNQRLLDAIPPDQRIITQYDAYFDDPEGEIRRVLDFLALPVTDERIETACAAVTRGSRHHRFTTQHMRDVGVTPAILDLYIAMCDEASGIAADHPYRSSGQQTGDPTGRRIGPAATGVGRLDRVAMEIIPLRDEINALKAVVGNAKEEQEQLRARGHGLERQLAKLREEYERRGAYVGALEQRLVARDAAIAEQTRYIAGLETDIAAKDAYIGELHALIPPKETYIARTEATVTTQQRYIAALEDVIPLKDTYIAYLEAVIPAKDGYIAKLEGAIPPKEAYIAHLEAAIPIKEEYIAHLEAIIVEQQHVIATFEVPTPNDGGSDWREAAISAHVGTGLASSNDPAQLSIAKREAAHAPSARSR